MSELMWGIPAVGTYVIQGAWQYFKNV